MSKINPLVGITLGGFQVFDEPTYIPLDRLTLIFGPNSAGKSAVQDAIDTVKALEADKNLFSEPGGSPRNLWAGQIQRHQRRSTDGVNQNQVPMLIYIKQRIEPQIDQCLAIALGKTPHDNNAVVGPIEIENRWSYCNEDFDYDLFIESEQLISFKGEFGLLSINLRHSILKDIGMRTNFSKFASDNPSLASFDNGIFSFQNRIVGFHPCGLGFVERRARWLQYAINPSEEPGDEGDSAAFDKALADISLLVGWITSIVNVSLNFHWDNVPASRHIPAASEVTFDFGSDVDEIRLPIERGKSRYRPLARSLSSELYSQKFLSSVSEKSPKHLSDCVNHALSNHLFLGMVCTTPAKARVSG